VQKLPSFSPPSENISWLWPWLGKKITLAASLTNKNFQCLKNWKAQCCKSTWKQF